MSHAPFDQPWAHGIYKQKYAQNGEEWSDTAARVPYHVLKSVGLESSDDARRIQGLIEDRLFIPGGRYLYASGRDLHQVQNCALYRAGDTREEWAGLVHKVTMALMTGAGVGVDYSAVRESGSIISRTGGVASGPISLMKMVNEVGRNVMQGGARRSAIWAGLAWWHPDVFDFIAVKDWSEEIKALKEKDFTFPADLDMTNISVQLDKAFFDAMNGDDTEIIHNRMEDGRGEDWSWMHAPDGSTWESWAKRVYEATLEGMLVGAEPGFSVDYDDRHESLRNACTEITSADDSDICNLGSLNLARFDTKEQFASAVRDATLFLLAGTVYSDLPHQEVYETREKNRRLGLGLMGIHEWLLKRGRKYGPDAELGEWLEEYERSTEYAHELADAWGISRPVKTRAIAPNGTIGILAETTTSAEPIFCAAYKRRVRNAGVGRNGDTVQFEYVVDPTAKRLIDQGVDPSTIEDAYTLSMDVERRVEMQHWLQRYVDHGISSTVNLPYPMHDVKEREEFGEMLLKYLPGLRGITCYPDGSRGGQPLTPVDVEFALQNSGVRFEESEERCVGGVCGS
jgi:ribonucleoside-diphosphate reductase alpha chain